MKTDPALIKTFCDWFKRNQACLWFLKQGTYHCDFPYKVIDAYAADFARWYPAIAMEDYQELANNLVASLKLSTK